MKRLHDVDAGLSRILERYRIDEVITACGDHDIPLVYWEYDNKTGPDDAEVATMIYQAESGSVMFQHVKNRRAIIALAPHRRFQDVFEYLSVSESH